MLLLKSQRFSECLDLIWLTFNKIRSAVQDFQSSKLKLVPKKTVVISKEPNALHSLKVKVLIAFLLTFPSFLVHLKAFLRIRLGEARIRWDSSHRAAIRARQ
jgi:hypothetical protein